MKPINRLNLVNDQGLSLLPAPKKAGMSLPPATFQTLITPEASALLADDKERDDMLDSAISQLHLSPMPGDGGLVLKWNKGITMLASVRRKEIRVMTNQQYEEHGYADAVKLQASPN